MRKRPGYRDGAITYLAANDLLEDVRDWLIAHGGDPYTDDELRRDIMDAIEFHNDGYEICQQLERASWFPDARLVEIMEDASRAKRKALEMREARWVEKVGLTPKHEIGEVVEFRRRDKIYYGEIKRVDAKQGRYIIFNDELCGPRDSGNLTGIYVNFEDIIEEVPCPKTT